MLADKLLITVTDSSTVVGLLLITVAHHQLVVGLLLLITVAHHNWCGSTTTDNSGSSTGGGTTTDNSGSSTGGSTTTDNSGSSTGGSTDNSATLPTTSTEVTIPEIDKEWMSTASWTCTTTNVLPLEFRLLHGATP